MTSSGETPRFLVACHSAARSGFLAASEFVEETRLPRQNGHPPSTSAQSCGDTDHSWSEATGHFHQTGRTDPAVTQSGVRSPFRVGCHWRAKSGRRVATLLVTETWRPAQKGHPVLPVVRLFADARHSWSGPRGHFHQTLRPEP